MADRIVVNTGPLIALGRAGVLELLDRLPFEFVAPMQVREELQQGDVAGHLPAALRCATVHFVDLPAGLSRLATANLGAGEAAVIQLALDKSIPVVCIDERKGRRAALSVGLRVTGTLGLLGRLKTVGAITSARPLVERLRGGRDWFSEGLLDRFLRELGEA